MEADVVFASDLSSFLNPLFQAIRRPRSFFFFFYIHTSFSSFSLADPPIFEFLLLSYFYHYSLFFFKSVYRLNRTHNQIRTSVYLSYIAIVLFCLFV